MQSKQRIAGGSSIPPAQKPPPPPPRTDLELARELRLAQDLVQGNPAKIAKNLRSLIHDPLRAVTRDFNSSKDLTERARLHRHRIHLVTCLIRAEAAILLQGTRQDLLAQREAKIDTPLKGVEEMLWAERRAWRGDQSSFNHQFGYLIQHRAALSLMTEQADQKLYPKPSRFNTSAKKAVASLNLGLTAMRERAASLLPQRNKAEVAVKGVAAASLAGLLIMGVHGHLTEIFTKKAGPLPIPVAADPNPRAVASIGAPVRPVRKENHSVEDSDPAPLIMPNKRQQTEKRGRTPQNPRPLSPAPATERSEKTETEETADKEGINGHLRVPPAKVPAADLRSTLSASIAEWTTRNTDKRYRLGGNNSRFMDCSQFIMGGLKAARERIEGLHGIKLDINGLQTISAQITKVMANAGGYLSGRNVTRSKIEPGMIIGVDSGRRGWDKDRWNGIDHIAITYQEPKTGDLYVAESTSEQDPVAKKTGVRTMPFSTWLDQASSRGYRMIVADVLSLARDNGQSVVAKLTNPPAEKNQKGSYRYAVYKMPAVEARQPAAIPVALEHSETFNSYARIQVAQTIVVAQEERRDIPAQQHSGISQSEREQALQWSRQQVQLESAPTAQPVQP